MATIDGKTILPAGYDYIGDYALGDLLDVACNLGDLAGQGFVDRSGKEVIPARFSSASFPEDGISAVTFPYGKSEERAGHIRSGGGFVVPPTYLHAFPFADAVAAVETVDGWTVINKDFRPRFTPRKIASLYPSPRSRQNDQKTAPILFYFSVDATDEKGSGNDYLVGVIDVDGNTVIPAIYNNAGIEDGFITVDKKQSGTEYGRLEGAFDLEGNQILPIVYDSVVLRIRNDNSLLKRYDTPLYMVELNERARLVAAGNAPVTAWSDRDDFLEALSDGKLLLIEKDKALELPPKQHNR